MDDHDVTRERDIPTRHRATVLAISASLVLAAVATGVFLLGGGPGTATPHLSTPTGSVLPTTHPVRPSAVPAVPVVGYGFSAADDTSAHQLVVFGGIDSYDTTWVWDGSRWSIARSAVHPPGRFGAAAAYDPSQGVVLVFGGRLALGELAGDTWAWDGSSWQELDGGVGGPPAGEGAMMAWDATLHEMVLLTGSGATVEATWLWQSRHWMRANTAELPSGTLLAGLAFDPATHLLIAATCCVAPTTWQWDGAGWRAAATRTSPPAMAVVGLAYDPRSGALVACSAPSRAPIDRQVWSWGGGDWSPLAGKPLPEEPATAVSDGTGGRLLMLGWAVQPTQGFPQPLEGWSWTGSGWLLVW